MKWNLMGLDQVIWVAICAVDRMRPLFHLQRARWAELWRRTILHPLGFKFVVVAFTIHNFNSQVYFIYMRLIWSVIKSFLNVKNLLRFKVKADNVTKYLANYAKLRRVRILVLLLWTALKIARFNILVWNLATKHIWCQSFIMWQQLTNYGTA